MTGQINLDNKVMYLYGGFAGTEESLSDRKFKSTTILDADSNGRVFYINKEYAMIDGFTITGGIGTEGTAGAGSYPEIINCSIHGNTAGSSGGGGICINNNANVTVTNCTITGNSTNYGGGIQNYL